MLEVYHRPYGGKCPQVCLDEVRTPLVGEVVRLIPGGPAQFERFDCEYARHGTANLFTISESLVG